MLEFFSKEKLSFLPHYLFIQLIFITYQLIEKLLYFKGYNPNTTIIYFMSQIVSMPHVSFFKKGFHHVGQAGLELLTSGDPPALTS